MYIWAYFIVYATQFLSCSPGQKHPLLRQLRSEYLLIYRLQSHNNPKRRKEYLKGTGQQSFKEQVQDQRKASKSAKNVFLNIRTYFWEQDAGGSNPSTRTSEKQTTPYGTNPRLAARLLCRTGLFVFRFQIAPTSLGCDLASSAGLKRTASILFCSHTPILEKPPFQAVFLHSVKESRFSLAENRDSLTGFLFDKTFDKSFEKSIQFLIDV